MSIIPNLEASLAQNSLYDKMLAKYKDIKKEKDDLSLEYSKLQKEYESFRTKEQNKYSELQKEKGKLNKLLQDLKAENKSLLSKLTLREQDIKDLSSRFDTKLNLEEKNKERDINLFSKFMGRKPVVTNSQDSKLLTIISTYENQKEKAEKKAQELEKELIHYRNNYTNINTPKANLAKNSKNLQNDLIEKVESLTTEKNALEEQFFKTTENLNKMKIESDKMNIKYEEVYKLLEKYKAQNNILKKKIEFLEEENENKENLPCNLPPNTPILKAHPYEFEEKLMKKEKESSEEQMIIQKICKIFAVNDHKDLMNSIMKTEKVMKAIPKLEEMMMEIYRIVLPKIGLEISHENVDKVIPAIQQWANHQNLFREIVNFKNNLISLLEFQNPASVMENDIYQEIISLKKKLKNIGEENNKIYEEMGQEKSKNNLSRVFQMFQVNSEEDLIEKISYIFAQFQDFQNFINIGKKLLQFENDENENFLEHTLKILERIKMNKREDIDFLIKLESEFKTSDFDHIYKKIKNIIKNS